MFSLCLVYDLVIGTSISFYLFYSLCFYSIHKFKYLPLISFNLLIAAFLSFEVDYFNCCFYYLGLAGTIVCFTLLSLLLVATLLRELSLLLVSIAFDSSFFSLLSLIDCFTTFVLYVSFLLDDFDYLYKGSLPR